MHIFWQYEQLQNLLSFPRLLNIKKVIAVKLYNVFWGPEAVNNDLLRRCSSNSDWATSAMIKDIDNIAIKAEEICFLVNYLNHFEGASDTESLGNLENIKQTMKRFTLDTEPWSVLTSAPEVGPRSLRPSNLCWIDFEVLHYTQISVLQVSNQFSIFNSPRIRFCLFSTFLNPLPSVKMMSVKPELCNLPEFLSYGGESCCSNQSSIQGD